MLWVGLTGGIGTGKSTASDILRSLNYSVLDADKVATKSLQKGTPGYNSVLDDFGDSILDLKGNIDRLKLGKIVFNDSKRLYHLEQIVHPLVQSYIADKKSELIAEGVALSFYDVPLLYEKKMQENFDSVILISSTQELQVSRTQKRSGISEKDILARIKNQLPLCEKEKLADFIINNNGSLVELEEKVKLVVQQLIKS